MEKTFKMSLRSVIDHLLATSALRGDITGRGDMLIDNDDAALEAVALVAIPAFMAENGIPFTETEGGWLVGPTTLNEAQIIMHASEWVLRSLSGECGAEVNEVSPQGGYPLITPWGP